MHALIILLFLIVQMLKIFQNLKNTDADFSLANIANPLFFLPSHPFQTPPQQQKPLSDTAPVSSVFAHCLLQLYRRAPTLQTTLKDKLKSMMVAQPIKMGFHIVYVVGCDLVKISVFVSHLLLLRKL